MFRAFALGGFGAAIVLTAMAGCYSPAARTLDSPDPNARIEAAARAGIEQDRSAIAGLIMMLRSDDAAARLAGITALHQITGERLGYEHAAPERERLAAADAWEAWLEREGRRLGSASADARLVSGSGTDEEVAHASERALGGRR
ncbi:MAG: hypothetical protein SFZ23_14365 [Planctomycetota bacterium]|nr:hypothetical protein [Planctomycetota bacterium]